MSEGSTTARAGFWDRGGFWKAVLVGVGYVAINTAIGYLVVTFLADSVDTDDLLGDPLSIFLGACLSILVNGIVLAIIARRLGWWGQMLRQPASLSRSWWMWLPFLGVLGWNLMRFVAADYSQFTVGSIVMILVLGALVGFAEELATRGLAVNLLRRAGYREAWVAVLSSLVFAAMHLGNAFSMDVPTVLITVVYTFFFGLAMYLVLRVTRSLIWPMILHATTDPSGMLLAGGIDETTEAAATGGLAAIAAMANYVVMILGIILVWFIRGRIDRFREFGLGEPAGEASAPAAEATA
ncbi:CPBP family intramembrane glutamic endopeptidase [Demequina iriomotensis]|uniref:CPBP family intramembrane glutamic endopeptidase n=1 Tax=Demequina iriomotensis TaxID=1536641 RepID=UPI0007834C5E|nr:CPBP family intramembrane glutamic endopeptidase [Demequina iriomotensis]